MLHKLGQTLQTVLNDYLADQCPDHEPPCKASVHRARRGYRCSTVQQYHTRDAGLLDNTLSFEKQVCWQCWNVIQVQIKKVAILQISLQQHMSPSRHPLHTFTVLGITSCSTSCVVNSTGVTTRCGSESTQGPQKAAELLLLALLLQLLLPLLCCLLACLACSRRSAMPAAQCISRSS